MNHIDWEPFKNAVQNSQNPQIQMLAQSQDEPLEKVTLFLADQLDALTDETQSHDAALEWVSREYDMPAQLLARVFYDDMSLGDLIRAKKELPGLKRGKRTPMSRFLAYFHGHRYNNKDDWEKGKRDLLQFAQAIGTKFYRYVMPKIQLADSPREAKEALLNRGAEKVATVRKTWKDEGLADRGRRFASLGLGDFEADIRGFQVTGSPDSLIAFGLLGSTPRSRNTLGGVVASLRKAGYPVVNSLDAEIGGKPYLRLTVRASQDLARQLEQKLRSKDYDVTIRGIGGSAPVAQASLENDQ